MVKTVVDELESVGGIGASEVGHTLRSVTFQSFTLGFGGSFAHVTWTPFTDSTKFSQIRSEELQDIRANSP